MRHLRRQLFHILHKPEHSNPIARYANYFLAGLILANALFVALETVPTLVARFGAEFKAFEAASTALFTVEYLARLWLCTEQSRYAQPMRGRLAYAVHPLPLLDLIVIVTYWMPIDLRFLRVARMVRLLKVLRLDGLEQSLEQIGHGVRRRSTLIVIAVMLMLLCIYASSALIYQLEHDAQPAAFSSIPATFWWALETLTTIGYGDIVPITPMGKLCAGLISIFGIGIFALPTAIVTAVVLETGGVDSHDSTSKPCPHCGRHSTAGEVSEKRG